MNSSCSPSDVVADVLVVCDRHLDWLFFACNTDCRCIQPTICFQKDSHSHQDGNFTLVHKLRFSVPRLQVVYETRRVAHTRHASNNVVALELHTRHELVITEALAHLVVPHVVAANMLTDKGSTVLIFSLSYNCSKNSSTVLGVHPSAKSASALPQATYTSSLSCSLRKVTNLLSVTSTTKVGKIFVFP